MSIHSIAHITVAANIAPFDRDRRFPSTAEVSDRKRTSSAVDGDETLIVASIYEGLVLKATESAVVPNEQRRVIVQPG